MIERQQILFNENWVLTTKSEDISVSWAKDVLDALSGHGGVYLSTINAWYLKFPFINANHSQHMKKRLESLTTEDHLGAVNELFCYNLASLLGWNIAVIAEKKSSPDFKVILPATFYLEVTTLNVSKADRDAFSSGASVGLNHGSEATRILRKTTKEKADQLKYGYDKQMPTVLIVFDYSTFSGLGTQRPQVLANLLLRSPAGLQVMPEELSALVYLERYVSEGKFRLRLSQSAVYHNPLATYPIEQGVFNWLTQFSLSDLMESPQQISLDLLVL